MFIAGSLNYSCLPAPPPAPPIPHNMSFFDRNYKIIISFHLFLKPFSYMFYPISYQTPSFVLNFVWLKLAIGFTVGREHAKRI